MGFRLVNVGSRAALAAGDHYFDIEATSDGSLSTDPMDALTRPDELSALHARLDDFEPTGALDDAVFDCPVPAPRNVFGIGLNYLDHTAESDMELPENPLVFTKFPSCLCGPDTTVELRSDFADWEAELVVVIGSGGKDIAEADAWNHVAGLTMGQDISDRRMQFAASPPHFDLGKSFDTYGPIGPAVVSVDEIGDPENLRITCSINGEQKQDGNTKDLIFGVPKLISYLSHVTTLSTGDLIFTGTPAGIGAAQGVFLRDGDVIETSIGNADFSLGVMTNRCVRVADHA